MVEDMGDCELSDDEGDLARLFPDPGEDRRNKKAGEEKMSKRITEGRSDLPKRAQQAQKVYSNASADNAPQDLFFFMEPSCGNLSGVIHNLKTPADCLGDIINSPELNDGIAISLLESSFDIHGKGESNSNRMSHGDSRGSNSSGKMSVLDGGTSGESKKWKTLPNFKKELKVEEKSMEAVKNSYTARVEIAKAPKRPVENSLQLFEESPNSGVEAPPPTLVARLRALRSSDALMLDMTAMGKFGSGSLNSARKVSTPKKI